MAKTYLVTGTSRGLGLEFVKQLAARGDKVIACSRSRDGAKEAARLAARFVELDTADDRSIHAAATALRGEAIDVLINNAGVLSEDRTIETVDMADFARVFATNVAGPAVLTKVLLPNLRDGKKKQVVNISSGLGSLSTVPPGFGYAYCASKSALNMVTVRTAQDLAKEGFTIVTFSPGWVRTDMGGKDATLSPEESIGAMLKTIDGLTTSRERQVPELRRRPGGVVNALAPPPLPAGEVSRGLVGGASDGGGVSASFPRGCCRRVLDAAGPPPASKTRPPPPLGAGEEQILRSRCVR